MKASNPAWRRALAALALPLACAIAQAQDYGDTPYVQTPQNVVDRMLEVAKVGPSDFVIDLGSGDGRMVITAVKKHGARGFGVDLDRRLVTLSNRNAQKQGVADRAVFYERDIYETDLSPASVVTIYLLPEVNLMMRPKLLSMLKPGTRVVSHDYDMGEWPPDVTFTMDAPGKPVGRDQKSKVFYWVVPAKASGRWVWRSTGEGGTQHNFELALQQNFQKVEGTLTADGKPVPIEDAKLVGDTLTFVAKLDASGDAQRIQRQDRQSRHRRHDAQRSRRRRAPVEQMVGRAHRNVGAAPRPAASADAHPADAAVTIAHGRASSCRHRVRACTGAALAFATFASCAVAAATLDVPTPYIPSTRQNVDEMLRLAEVRPGDVVYDLGSGDGRVVISAARDWGARGVGIEIDGKLVAESRESARREGVGDRVSFREGDVFAADLKDATVVTLYLLTSLVHRLQPKLVAELKPGTRIVAHDYGFADWQPDRHVNVSKHFYLYVVPAKVAGKWRMTSTLPQGARDYEMDFEQRYQEVKGGARVAGGFLPAFEARLSGERVAFVLMDDDMSYRYEGRVSGNAMEGVVRWGYGAKQKESPWRAVRAAGGGGE